MTNPAQSARFVTCHSILQLDANHPLIRRSILDAQDMHRTVMSGFRGWIEKQPDARSQFGVLSTWTIDLKTDSLLLVVQSRIPPDWSPLPSTALLDKPRLLQIDTTLRTGDKLTFRTVVNPSSQGRNDKRTSKNHPDTPALWFTKRLQPADESPTGPTGVIRIGADTDPSTLRTRPLPAAIAVGETHKGLKIARAEITGSLTITDPPTLLKALTLGIGHARAYSCGLLLTKPALQERAKQ